MERRCRSGLPFPWESTAKSLPAKSCLTSMFDAWGVHLLTDQASTYQDVAGRTDTIQVILNTEPALRFMRFCIPGPFT